MVILNKLCWCKSLIFKKDPDIEKVLVSNKISSGEKNYKYFIGYLCNDHRVKPLHIIFPKSSANMNIFFDWRWWLVRKIYYYLG